MFDIRNAARGFLTCVIVIAILGTVAVSPAIAQERYGNFRIEPGEPSVLRLEGEIRAGDLREFERAIARNPGIETIVLSSPGGDVLSALRMAEMIHTRGLTTIVPDAASCASACAYLLFAGSPRLVQGNLGVHQFSSPVDRLALTQELQRETQTLAAEIIDVLNRFDTPPVVYAKMYVTPPERVYWFDRQELSELGLAGAGLIEPVPTIESRPSLAPQDVAQPSFDCRRATTQVELTVCSDHMLSALDREMAMAYVARRLSLPQRDRSLLLDQQRAWHARLSGCVTRVDCIEAAYVDRLEELSSTGSVDERPSFECRAARTATERAICSHGALAALDRRMAESYSHLRSRLNDNRREALLVDQRGWLTDLGSCQADVICIERRYRERIRVLER